MPKLRNITPAVYTILVITASMVLVPASSMAESDEGSTLYYSANALYNQKLYTLAVGEYKVLMENYPEHAKIKDAHYGLALCYFALGKHAEAAPELKTVLESGMTVNTNQLSLMLGQCQLKMNKPADAENSFSILTSEETPGPLTSVALAGLAEAQFRQGKWNATIKTTDRIVKSEPTATILIRGLYQGGYARHQLKKYTEAIPVFEKLLETAAAKSLKEQASFILAECCRETGDLKKAAENYADAIELEGSQHEVLYRLGFVQFMLKNYASATVSLEKSLKIKPDSSFAANVRIYIARSYIEQKNYAEAITLLAPAESTTIPNDETSLWLARAYTFQKKNIEASKVLQSALTNFPESKLLRELKFDLANAQIATGDFKNAGTLLDELLKDPKWEQQNDATRLYAVCLHKTGNYAKSLTLADKFLTSAKNDKSFSDILFLKAENLYLSENLDAALTSYTAFINKYPSHQNADAATLRTAQIHYRKNSWQKALDLATPLATKNPSGEVFSDLTFLIGDCNFRIEKWDAAITALSAFLEKYPTGDSRIDTALVELGVAEVRKGANAKASTYFTKLVTEHPKSSHCSVAYTELGRISYEAGEYVEAQEAMEKCLEIDPDGPQRPKAKYYLGWIALKNKKDDVALQHFQDLINTDPKHNLAADSSLQLGLLQLAAKKYDDAKKTLNSFLIANPKHSETVAATYTLGVAQARSDEKQKAVTQFTKVITQHADSEYADRALYELAWCYKDLKNNKMATTQYEALLEKYPTSKLVTRVRVELAELTFDAKDYDKVIAELEKTLTDLTDKGLREQTLYRLGTAWFNTGTFDKCAKAFEDMVIEFPESKLIVSARYQAGEARLKLLETEAARTHFLAVTKMNPDAGIMESALMRLGETDSLTKRWSEASISYGSFLEKFPNSKWLTRAQFGYALALEKQGQHKEALAEYRKITAKKGQDELTVRSQFQVGECLFALKQYDEAIKELVRVTVSFGDKEWSAKAFLETGRVLEAKGDKDKAIEQFRKTVEKYPGHNVAIVAKQRLDALRRNK